MRNQKAEIGSKEKWRKVKNLIGFLTLWIYFIVNFLWAGVKTKKSAISIVQFANKFLSKLARTHAKCRQLFYIKLSGFFSHNQTPFNHIFISTDFSNYYCVCRHLVFMLRLSISLIYPTSFLFVQLFLFSFFFK